MKICTYYRVTGPKNGFPLVQILTIKSNCIIYEISINGTMKTLLSHLFLFVTLYILWSYYKHTIRELDKACIMKFSEKLYIHLLAEFPHHALLNCPWQCSHKILCISRMQFLRGGYAKQSVRTNCRHNASGSMRLWELGPKR